MMKLKPKPLLALAACFFLCGGWLFGQRQISGKVTDADTGDPLIGANILVVGTSVGTVSDVDGTYALQVPAGKTQLEISYTGYTTLRLDLGASNVLDVQLQAGEALGEVLVIGYGTVKREDATGSVASVSSEDFNRGSITSPQELLAGKIAGVQITTDPAPGAGAQIRIRGGSSLSASNDPLVVIDGVPVDNGGVSGGRNIFNFVNPNDIETFTVLKDASATAIYGSRASNGVILITTKKGRLGKTVSVEYNGNFSSSKALQTMDLLDADEYRAVVADPAKFTSEAAQQAAAALLGDASTNWQDVILQTATGHDHNLSLSGGIGEVLPYRVSLGYTDKKGILKTDKFQRLTGSLNLSPKFMDNYLQINVNLKGMKEDNRFANRAAIGTASFFDPTQQIYQEGNDYGGFFTWTDPQGVRNTLAPHNPLALLELRNDESTVKRLVANGSADYRFHFLPDLRANLNLGYDHSDGEGEINVAETASFEYHPLDGNGAHNTYQQEKESSLLEFYLNYVKEFGSTKLDVMGGYSWQRFFFSDSFRNATATGGNVQEGEGSGELFLLSLFGRVNYTMFDRLLLTFTLRRDGTSRFSPDSRWGLFPAAAVGVKIVDEQKGALSNLKLRLGYGVTGQQDVGGFYLYLPRYLASFESASYQFGNNFISTLRPEGYDYNIKWEETTTYNAGLDYGLLDNKIYGSLEVYLRKTKDLINFVPVPAGSNLTNFITTNVGDLENRGVEFSVNATAVSKEKLTWDFGVNVSANENEITRLTAIDDPNYAGVLTGGISGGVGNTIQIHSVGYPANSFYVYEQVYDEAGVPIEGLYVDRNKDGIVNAEDRYRLEKPTPDLTFGFNSALKVGNFDLSLAGRANVGNYVYNNVWSESSYFDLYHPTNYLGNLQGVSTEIDFRNQQLFSDYFIKNASFLRLDHVTLGYDFGKMIDNVAGLKLFFTVQNPLLVTNYEGVDPEIAGGIDNNIYPRTRTFVFGLNARF